MKLFNVLLFIFMSLLSCNKGNSNNEDVPDIPKESNSIRVGTFNVGVGQKATAEEIASSLKSLYLDILSLQECPVLIDNNSGEEEFYLKIAKTLGMEYFYVGKMSSGNHWVEWGVDKTGKYAGKYKVIMSKTPILKSQEFALTGTGWINPSTIRIETKVKDREITVYSLHIPSSNGKIENSVMKNLVDSVIKKDNSKRIIVMGDFNDLPETSAMQYIFDSGFISVWDGLKDQEQSADSYKYGKIDNILIRKLSGMRSKLAYSIFSNNGSLSDHPYVWSEIEIGE